MIAPGQRVAVAASGGPDSTGLLHLLQQLTADLGFTLAVAHFNHRLRGEESNQDEEFVRKLANELQIPFFGSSADVRKLAEQAGGNIEQTARQARYDYFLSLVDSGQVDLVAVGHTADDQAETVLQRLLRGSGNRGMAGIHPTRDGCVIRPLIEIRRQEVLDWLRDNGYGWREDSSNRDLRFVRNRIRHRLLPALAEFNPSIVKTLAQTGEIARDEEAFWEEYLQPILTQHIHRNERVIEVDIVPLKSMPVAVARRFLRYALEETARQDYDRRTRLQFRSSTGAADFLHTQQILDLALNGQSGSTLALPGDVLVRKEFSGLVIEKAAQLQSPFRGYAYEVTVPETVQVPEIPGWITFELIPWATEPPRYNGKREDLLDRRVIEGSLLLRNWQAGDSYVLRGHRKSRKLKELFQRWRVSSSMRKRWPVLVAENQIVWSRRGGVAEGFAPCPGSAEAVRIRETH